MLRGGARRGGPGLSPLRLGRFEQRPPHFAPRDQLEVLAGVRRRVEAVLHDHEPLVVGRGQTLARDLEAVGPGRPVHRPVDDPEATDKLVGRLAPGAMPSRRSTLFMRPTGSAWRSEPSSPRRLSVAMMSDRAGSVGCTQIAGSSAASPRDGTAVVSAAAGTEG